METDCLVAIGELEQRLAKVGAKIETTKHEDRILLLHVERVAAHCKRTSVWADKSPPKLGDQEEKRSLHGSSPEELPSSRGSSPTDTTTSEKSVQPAASIVTTSTPRSSLSILEARELFPSTPSPEDPETLPSSGSSCPSPRAHFVRKITHAREQQVRAIMSDMKKRMKLCSSS